MGVLLGTVSYCFMDKQVQNDLGFLQSSFIEGRQSVNFAGIMIRSLTSNTIFLAVVFLAGFSVIGQPIAIITLLIRGIGLGVTLAGFYGNYGRSGIIFSLAMLIPGAAISVVALAIGVRESIVLSNIYLRISLSSKQENGLLETIKLYGAKFFTLEVILSVSAGVDCLCSRLFGGLLAGM